MVFGWLVESGVTSNSVIYVKDQVTVGIGTGEQDRVGVAEIARDKAYRKLADRYCFQSHGIPYNDLKEADRKAEIDQKVADEKGGLIGSAMISDAFFPFRDGVDVGLREGVTAVIQPGGSGNDYQSIEACNEAGATMVFTGERSFKHSEAAYPDFQGSDPKFRSLHELGYFPARGRLLEGSRPYFGSLLRET